MIISSVVTERVEVKITTCAKLQRMRFDDICTPDMNRHIPFHCNFKALVSFDDIQGKRLLIHKNWLCYETDTCTSRLD